MFLTDIRAREVTVASSRPASVGRRRFPAVRFLAAVCLSIAVLPGLVWAGLWMWAEFQWSEALERAARVTCVAEVLRSAGPERFLVQLTGHDGTVVRGRMRRGTSARVDTAFLLLGGVRTGAAAVELFDPPPGAVVLACDYPLLEQLPEDDLASKVLSVPRLVSGATTSLASFALACHWLTHRPDVDRTFVVGVSLGVPYAAALASYPGVDGIALLYGGGEVGRIVERALPIEPRTVRRVAAFALARLIAPLDPARHVGRRPDLPVLLVNAAADRRIPPESVRALHEAAPATARRVMLPGDHVRPDAPSVVTRSVDEVVRWALSSSRPRDRGGPEGDAESP